MRDQGVSSKFHATLEALTEDVLKTSEIEGEHLNPDTVRSSIATRLGVDIGAIAPADRYVDGVVEMILDATRAHHTPLTAQRLTEWHAALFPTEQRGVHFEAPPATRLPAEIADLLLWFETNQALDPLIKAGLAHLWFVTIHPFDDGNGRIARAIGDLALARADQSKQRFYSLSAQIQQERKDYYVLLEKTQKGNLEATEWLSWFLACLLRALQEADRILSAVLHKANFWTRWAGTPFNARQVKVLNRMLDGFEGKLSNKKWAAIGKCSSDTALRDINDLVERGILSRTDTGGRSTSYALT